MSKIGLFLLWFGLFVAVCISLITTGASFNYAGPGNFFETPASVIAGVFYQQLTINFIAFALLSAAWDGTRQLWPRLIDADAGTNHRTGHDNNRGFYLLLGGLSFGTLVGFYQVAQHNTVPVFDTLGLFFKWLGMLSLPVTIIAALYASILRLRDK